MFDPLLVFFTAVRVAVRVFDPFGGLGFVGFVLFFLHTPIINYENPRFSK